MLAVSDYGKKSIGFRCIFTVALIDYFRLGYVNVNNCPAWARNMRKATVKI